MRLTVVALFCCGLVAGCGGVLHVSKGLSAKRAVEQARAANAAEKAAYHLALAELYLAQADIEATAAHGQEALAYDDLAVEHATAAAALARGEKLPSSAPPDPKAPPGKAPAKPAKKSSDEDDL